MRLFLSIILIFTWTLKGINAQNTNHFNNLLGTYKNAIILPKKDNNQLLLRELASQRPGRPVQFAISDTLSANIYNSGSWSTNQGGKEIWTLKIESKGALSINLGFKSFHLPGQTELYIFNKSKAFKLGPFTEKDNDEHLQFWTPIIKGDLVILELHIPTAKKDELLLELNSVNHDFLGFGKSFSGSCNLDVICGEEDGFEMVDLYRDILQSVGAYHINGTETCTGALLNNTKQDKRGFFLTANHCGINNNNDASVVTYWNYENSYCRLPNSTESGNAGDGNLSQFNSGSIFRASNSNTDFCLIELDDPIKPEYEPYFSGWERNFQSTEMAICIHHPGVEEKRISFEFDQVILDQGNFIEVLDWDIGTTEGGSSGSPLYTKEKKIIGQLQGGLAACSNNLSDNYGNFGISWDGSGTESTSLRPWLDPEDIGLTSLDGYNGAFGVDLVNNFQNICTSDSDSLIVKYIVQESFIDFVNIVLTNIPAPLQLVFSEDNLTPGTSNELIFTNVSSLDAGEYTIVLSSTDGTNTEENVFFFSVDDDLPPILLPLSPENGFAEASNEQILEWIAMDDNTTSIEVSTDVNFTNLFLSIDGLTEANYLLKQLSNLTTYFWRIRSVNKCGNGVWSEVYQFSTQLIYCINLQSEETIVISDSGINEIRSSIFFDYPVVIEKISIPNIDITHDYISDLDLELIDPETNENIVLLSQICDSEDNMNLGFSDNGVIIFPCPPIDGLLYQSITPLRNLKNLNAQGKWELLIRDNFNFDGGTLNSWEIEICFSSSEGLALIPLDSPAILCENDKADISFFYNLEGMIVTEIRVENAEGLEIPIDIIQAPSEDSGELSIDMSDHPNLKLGINELYLLIDNLIEVVFYIDVLAIPEIELNLSFGQGATIASLDAISWEGNNADLFTIEVSNSLDFLELIWSTEEAGNIETITGPALEDGDYYLRIIAENECGSISSDLYNFSVDESVSIIESTKKPLLLSQSLSRDEVLISGNLDNAHISVAVISISGHKLLSQSTNEASLLLDVSAIIPGVYILELRSGEERTIRKVVIY